MLLHTVFADEWRKGEAWQKRLLSLWRLEIVNDVPVVDEVEMIK